MKILRSKPNIGLLERQPAIKALVFSCMVIG